MIEIKLEMSRERTVILILLGCNDLRILSGINLIKHSGCYRYRLR
jgi:hypothetical protein